MNRYHEKLKPLIKAYLDKRQKDGSFKELSNYGLLSAFATDIYFGEDGATDGERDGLQLACGFLEEVLSRRRDP